MFSCKIFPPTTHPALLTPALAVELYKTLPPIVITDFSAVTFGQPVSLKIILLPTIRLVFYSRHSKSHGDRFPDSLLTSPAAIHLE